MTRCSVLAAASFAILLGTTGCKDATPPPQPAPTAVVQPAPAAERVAKGDVAPTTSTIFVEEQLTAVQIDPNTNKLDFRRLGDQGPGFKLSFPSSTSSKPSACLNGPTAPVDVCDHYECDLNPVAQTTQVYYKLEPLPPTSCSTASRSTHAPVRYSVVHCGRGC
jgi:hypothetical protein